MCQSQNLTQHTRTSIHRFGQGNPKILEVAQRISQLTSCQLQLKFNFTSVQTDHFSINTKQQLLQQIRLQSWVAHLMPLHNKLPTQIFTNTSLQSLAMSSLTVCFSTITVHFHTITVHFSTIVLTESLAQWHTTVNRHSFSECSTPARIDSR